MSAFDGIFGSSGGGQSSLFSNLAPSDHRQDASAGPAGAAGSDAAPAASGKAAKHSAPGIARNPKKRKRNERSSERPPEAAANTGKKPKSGKPAAATAAATGNPTSDQPQPAKRQKASKAAAAAANSVPGESAAANAARAAAAKLLKLDGVSQQDIEPPPLHETQQEPAAQAKRKRKQQKERKQKQQPPPATKQAETPAERIHNGSAAPSAEQPLGTAPNSIEQAQDRAEDDKLDRTIFVGNLRAVMKPRAIKQLFSRYGSVESVRLRSVPVQPEAVALPRRAAVLTGKVDSERATAHAYVVFAAPEQAQAALAHNMQVVDGLHVRVDMATGASGTAGAKSYSRGRSIFVGNLPFTAQDEDIVQLFSDGALDPELADAVTAVRVVRDRQTNIGKGIAFVEFKTKAAAAAALRLAGPKLRGRPLRITFLKQPKASAMSAAAEAAPAAKPGEAADGSGARERLRKQKMAASSAKKASRQPWMGERAKANPQRAAAAKGKSPAAAPAKAALGGVQHRTGLKPRTATGKQGRGGSGRPSAKSAGGKPGGRPPRDVAK